MMFGDFMMGARSRLLPPSVPFRFFAVAALLQVPAWIVLAVFAADAPAFMGGLGHILTSLHMITLGVLLMTAMGASFQLLPVATKKPVRSVAACKLVFWLYLPGLVLLVHGMGHQDQIFLSLGAGLTVAGIALFAFLLADNLRRVSDMRVVTDHAWIALTALVLLAVLGSVLVADFAFGFLPDHHGVALAHGVVAAYGFMGMLAMGFSFVLIPLFGLSPPPNEKLGRRSAWIGGVAILLAMAGLVHGLTPLVFLAGGLGLISAGLHLYAMALVMKSRMKKALGVSFIMIRLAWVLFPVSIVIGLLAAAGVAVDCTGPLFGFILVFGWLLTFLLGVQQRILPFLASMHSVKKGVKPILVSTLTADRPLRLHMVCHCAALLCTAVGLAWQIAWLVRLGAVTGAIGAVSFLVFATMVWRRLYQHLQNRVPQSEKA